MNPIAQLARNRLTLRNFRGDLFGGLTAAVVARLLARIGTLENVRDAARFESRGPAVAAAYDEVSRRAAASGRD